MSLRWVLVALLLLGTQAHAKRFRNAYVSFELPPNWNCKLEGSEWVCENEFAGKTKEAIIILTAKEVGPTDTMASYLAHLQTPVNLPTGKGQMAKSQVIHVKERMIGNQMWIDGMHLGSEIGPYFTRYLATIKDKIAILVTFSAHKQHYTKYSGDFIRAVESLRVVATKDSLGERGGALNNSSGNGETIGAPIGQSVSPYSSESMPEENAHSGNSNLMNYLVIALLLAAVGGYFFVKSKPKKKKSSSNPPPPNQPKGKK